MSDFQKELRELEETLKQIELEKSNLIEHLKRQDKNYSETINTLKTVYTSKLEFLTIEVERLNSSLTGAEGDGSS